MPERIYTGAHPQDFITGGIGHLEPNQRFECPAELCEGFDRRADIAVPAGDYEEAERELRADEAIADASASQEADTSGGTPSGRRGHLGSSGKKDDAKGAVS